MRQRIAIWALACVAATGVSVLAQTADPGFGPYPPAPKAEPFTETVHGVTVSDPYRWMESPSRRDEMIAWVKASSAQATAGLARLPGRAQLLRSLEDVSRSSATHYNVQLAGGRLFFLELAPDGEIAVLKVRENGQDRLFLDPMAGEAAGTHRTINNYAASPDGNLVAICMAEGGAEVGTTRIYDVTSGKPLNEALTPIWGEFEVNWLDNQTLTYTRMNNAATHEEAMENMTVYLHHVGTPMTADVALLGSRVGPALSLQAQEFPVVMTSQRSPWAIATAGGARADARYGFTSLASLRAGKPQWAAIAGYEDKVNAADISGNTFYYLTTAQDPNGEVRAIELGKDTVASSRLVLASGGRVLKSLMATTAGLYVGAMAPNASSRLLFLANGAAQAVEVPLPMTGSISSVSVTYDRSTMTFGFDSMTRNITFYRAQDATIAPLGLADTTAPVADNMTVVEETASSADGTKVPLTITAPKGKPRPLPALMDAYASYGISGEPYYSPSVVVWVTRGGVYAECHARGGGEKGRAWHEAGRSVNKVNAMADVIACGERLVELGYTTPKLMGIWGTSAGGLLIPQAGLKRPDLFAAVVTSVGIVNATRLAVATNGPNQFAEMGDPNTDAGFKALAAQDSTLLLASSKGGTSQLLTIGLNDRRVEPWMSAKLVAMMRAKWGDEHLVLIRSDADAGHGIGSAREQRLQERADIFAFLLNRFGQPGFTFPADTPHARSAN